MRGAGTQGRVKGKCRLEGDTTDGKASSLTVPILRADVAGVEV